MASVVLSLLGNSRSAERALSRTAEEARAASSALGEMARAMATANVASRLASKSLNHVGGRMAATTTAVAKTAGAMVTMASTAAMVGPALAPAAVALVGIGKAAGSAAPALLALGVAAKVTQVALAKIYEEGSAARKALTPLAALFNETGAAGSRAAARGIQPLAAAFKKAAFPVVSRYMTDVGKSAAIVTGGFLRWAKSTEGIKSLKGILNPIGASLLRLAPQVKTVGIEFAAMLGRIMGVSVAAGESGLSKVLDKITEKLKGITKKDVQDGLDKLKRSFETVRDVGRTLHSWIGKIVTAYKTYTTQFRALADVISILAIAFGGPVVAIAAAAGLIVRHFDDIKAAYARLSGAAASPAGQGFIQGIAAAAQRELPKLRQMVSGLGASFSAFGRTVLPPLKAAFAQIWAAISPPLTEIYNKVTTQLVPAFGQLVQALGPVVAWVVTKLSPIVAGAFGNILRIVSGAISIITGIFKVFTAVLTGDWGKAWDGLKQIVGGAAQIVGAIVRQFWTAVTGVFRLGTGLVKVIWRRLFDIIGSAARQGIATARAAIGAGLNLVKNAFSSALSAVTGIVSRAWSSVTSRTSALASAVTGKIRSLMSALRSAFSAGVSAIGKAWDGLKAAAKSPVNFVIDVYNKGIVGLVNKLASFVGIKHALGKVGRFAAGGVLPGYTPGRDPHQFYSPTGGRLALSGGEAVMRPEWTRAVGPRMVAVWNSIARTGGTSAVRAAMGGGKWTSGPDRLQGEGQRYSRGGVPSFGWGGIIGDFVSGVKNWTIRNVSKAASGLLGKVLGGNVPGAGVFRDVIAGLPGWVKNTVLGWIKGKVSSGGAGIDKAMAFMKAQVGKPYIWGGFGPGGYDCSGLMSALVNVIKGKNPYSRLFSTHSFGASGPAGFVRDKRSAFTVGVTDAGVGHMAGTLGGVNVESSGSIGPHMGASARGTDNSLFTRRYGLAMSRGGVLRTATYDQGGLLRPGYTLAYNGTGRDEVVTKMARGGVVPKITRETGQIPGTAKGADKAVASLLAKITKAMLSSLDKVKDFASSVSATIGKYFTGATKTRLLAWSKTLTTAMTAAATKLDGIASKIKEAREFAATTTQSAKDFAGLSGLGAGSAKGVVNGLRSRGTQLKTWVGLISKLAKKGLARGLLSQLIAMGPGAEGMSLAQQLLKADSATLRGINQAQSDIDKIAGQYGRTAADVLYDSGKGAAKGFLTGLLDQQTQLNSVMDSLGKRLAEGLNKALGVKPKPVAGIDRSTATAYDSGGMLQPGFTLAVNKTRRPEPVFTSLEAAAAYGPGGKGVTVNMGGVTVTEAADVDLLSRRLEFQIQAAML